jgi:hypothetical protein
MTPAEREFAIQRLLDGREALLRAIAGLSEAQQRFKAQPEDWSIADCVEHVAVVEDFLFPLVTHGVINPNGVSLDPAKDERMAAAVVDRKRKVSAPPAMRPVGAFASVAEASAKFRESRERSIAHFRDCQDDLRRLFMTHPVLGEIDCYRCLLLFALHPARHAAQIEEIKQQPGFPRPE